MQNTPAAVSISAACAAASAAALFVFALFPRAFMIAEFTVPAWLVAGALIAACVGSGVFLARVRQSSAAPMVAFLVFPGLTVAHTMAYASSGVNGQEFILAVIWAAAFVELVHATRPELMKKENWRALALLAVLVSCTWAGFVLLRDDNSAPLIIITLLSVLWAAVLRWMPEQDPKREARGIRLFWLIVTGIAVLWGGWLRVAAVDTFALQNDEFFTVAAAQGYIETGEYRLWDFVTEEAGERYERAWPYTWQAAKSIEALGISELSVRLPTLLWGLILLLAVPCIAWSWTRSYAVAALATFLVATDPGFIWASTYSRMYAMLAVIVTAALWLFWFAMKEPDEQCFPKSGECTKPRRFNCIQWGALIASLAMAFVAVALHSSALLIVGGMALTSWLLVFLKPQVKWYRWPAVLFIATGFASVLFGFFTGKRWFNFVGILERAEIEYFFLPFNQLIIPAAGAALFIGIVWLYRQQRIPTWAMITASACMPALVYLAYFSDRYSARKYVLFLLVPVFLLIAYGWHTVTRKMARTQIMPLVLQLGVFLIIFTPVTVPGFPDTFLTQQARADMSYDDLQLHDFPSGYSVIMEQAQSGDAVVMLQPRSFYLDRRDVINYKMPSNGEMAPEILQQIVANHEHGWIVWPRHKEFNLNQAFMDYVHERYEQVDAPGTNIVIYRW